MNIIPAYYFILSVLYHVDGARILGLFPHVGKSHFMVYQPLLKGLAERNHQVTVVSFFPTENPPDNYNDVSLADIAKPGVESVDLSYFEDSNKWLRLLSLDKIVMQISEFNQLADLALDICSKLVKFQPLADVLKKDYDVVLVENFNSDCVLGLANIYGLKAPFIALSSCVLMQWSPQRIGLPYNPAYVPMENGYYTAKMTFRQRVENVLLTEYYKVWYRHFIQMKEQAMIEKQFGKKIVDLEDLGNNVSMILVNVFHSLNGVRPLLPGVVEVGGMHLDHTKKSIPAELFCSVLPQKAGFESVKNVITSLIKTASIPKYKEEIIMRSLSKLKQRVIWKFENCTEESTLEGNILKIKWIPQYELLQHPKIIAFLAHGGLLGMTEAISAGKPMLVVPFFGDQPLNAAQAVDIGLAKSISYENLSEKTLDEGLRFVLSSEMRASARRASKIWHDRQNNPLDTAVFWTERVIRWGHTDPLHSAARDMPFYQRALLDVIATVLIILAVVLLILIIILKVIFRRIFQLFTKHENNKEKSH